MATSQKKKKAEELTTDEVLKKVFPNRVVKELKRIVRDSETPKKRKGPK